MPICWLVGDIYSQLLLRLSVLLFQQDMSGSLGDCDVMCMRITYHGIITPGVSRSDGRLGVL
jgi:hypothetical protein